MSEEERKYLLMVEVIRMKDKLQKDLEDHIRKFETDTKCTVSDVGVIRIKTSSRDSSENHLFSGVQLTINI